MLEKLQRELEDLQTNPPWTKKLRLDNSVAFEGDGAPEPGQFRRWQLDIRNLRRKIARQAEEDARRMIDRP